MGNNNRWAREGGVIDEILVENMYRNPEGNPLILDTILLEKVVDEPNITLLLNTAVHDLEKSDADTIESVRAFCSQNSTAYEVTAPLFCDASRRRHRRLPGRRGVPHGRGGARRVRRAVRAGRSLPANCSGTRSISTPRTPAGR